MGNPTYNIHAPCSDITFLGELDAGFDWAITANWRAFLGYRVIGLANVALADNQYLPFLADTQGFSQMKQNGDLILHGILGRVDVLIPEASGKFDAQGVLDPPPRRTEDSRRFRHGVGTNRTRVAFPRSRRRSLRRPATSVRTVTRTSV